MSDYFIDVYDSMIDLLVKVSYGRFSKAYLERCFDESLEDGYELHDIFLTFFRMCTPKEGEKK